MIYFPGHPTLTFGNDKKDINIEGSAEGDDTSMSTCPGITAPSCFSVSHFILTVFSGFIESHNYLIYHKRIILWFFMHAYNYAYICV